jgi:CRISPR-associated protein Cas5d
MNHRVLISGNYALFTRPEARVERVSYDVLTPTAARGVLEAVYWKPQFRWRILRIAVLNPIRFISVRRNELKGVVPAEGGEPVEIADRRQQRASLLLRDVRYAVEATMDVLDPRDGVDGPVLSLFEAERKHAEIFLRRMAKGAQYAQPFLGCREFPARVKLLNGEALTPHESLKGDRDLGTMLLDVVYDYDPVTRITRSVRPVFFHAVMRDGVIDLP